MIFRYFRDSHQNRNSYLIASPTSREAAIINPVEGCLSDYEAFLERRGLRLTHTFQTHAERQHDRAAEVLRMRTSCIRVAPSEALTVAKERLVPVDEIAKPGSSFSLSNMKIEAIEPPSDSECEVAYRVCDYTLSPGRVWIHDSVGRHTDNASTFESEGSNASHGDLHQVSNELVVNCRTTRLEVPVERLILEDLHTSLIESRFSPKEERVVRTYLEFLEDNKFTHPTAAQLSDLLKDVDRTAVHVLVHNIRWKQIDMARLPVVLAGQTSKWLRALQTEPQFTDHEKEFLSAYLRLVERNQRPPSGPDVASELSSDRSVQWIRKRAHTIRRKQKEFNQPVLILSRKSPQPIQSTKYHQPARRMHDQTAGVRWTA